MDGQADPRCIRQTVTAVTRVCHDLHRYVRYRKLLKHTDILRLIDDHTPDELAARFINGMPELIKTAFGRKGGIDLEACAILADRSSCIPDSVIVGCYFVFGLPLYEDDDMPMPSPGYGGESCNVLLGMKGRTDKPLDPEYLQAWPDKALYRIAGQRRGPDAAVRADGL